VATTGTAQTNPRDQPHVPPVGYRTIRGRVVRADTGEPLRRVQVHIDEWRAKDQGGPSSTMTDAQGRYELTQLVAGMYHLKATRGGFVEVEYGQRHPFERGRPIEIAEGAVLEHIDFAMPPGGVVTGRVLDEMGEAVAQASVSLLRRRYVDGERQLIDQNGSSTDDRGEFRIFGVQPGEYVMVARLETMDVGSRDRMRYVPTYYPGTAVANEAQRVAVTAGQEVSGIVIPLARAATAAVRGIVRSSGQTPGGAFTLITAREIGGAMAYGQRAMATAANDGSFTIGGLLPGTYLMEARSMSDKEFASFKALRRFEYRVFAMISRPQLHEIRGFRRIAGAQIGTVPRPPARGLLLGGLLGGGNARPPCAFADALRGESGADRAKRTVGRVVVTPSHRSG
jgi:hypothetical protein